MARSIAQRLLAGPILALLVLLSCGQAFAAAITITGGGSQTNFSYGASLGWDFQTNSAITVTALGIWDYGQAGLSTAGTVGIFTTSGTLVGSTTIAAGNGYTSGGYRYQDVAPIYLAANTEYLIGAITGDTVARLLGRGSFSVDPAITVLNGAFSSSGLFPNFGDTFSDLANDIYAGPNFLFGNVSTVPAPGALMLLGFGLCGLGLMRRRKVA